MTAREKKARRDEREVNTGTRSKKSNTEENSATTDARDSNPDEVFDSSKYGAMSDMTEGASLNSKNVNTLADSQGTESLRQGQPSNKSTSAGPSGGDSGDTANAPKITPMMVEERARTVRAAKEEINLQQPSTALVSQPRRDKFVLHLNLMLSIENAMVERLHARIQQCLLAPMKEQLVYHLELTRKQKDRLASLIQGLGGQATVERAQLVGYSPPGALANALEASTTQEEQELKTMEVDALIEHAESIGYNTLIQMAAKMNVGEALPPLRQSLKEEEDMVTWMRANLPSNFAELWSQMEQKNPSLRQSPA